MVPCGAQVIERGTEPVVGGRDERHVRKSSGALQVIADFAGGFQREVVVAPARAEVGSVVLCEFAESARAIAITLGSRLMAQR